MRARAPRHLPSILRIDALRARVSSARAERAGRHGSGLSARPVERSPCASPAAVQQDPGGRAGANGLTPLRVLGRRLSLRARRGEDVSASEFTRFEFVPLRSTCIWQAAQHVTHASPVRGVELASLSAPRRSARLQLATRVSTLRAAGRGAVRTLASRPLQLLPPLSNLTLPDVQLHGVHTPRRCGAPLVRVAHRG